MTTTVFDMQIHIKNEEGYKDIERCIGALEDMLNQYGIKHSFALPHAAVFEEKPNTVFALNYSEKDDMTVCLLYPLFCKIHRGAKDDMIGRALVAVGNRFAKKEVTTVD